MRKYTLIFTALLSMTAVLNTYPAYAGPLCDAAQEQHPTAPSANPATGNPYQSGDAGATIGGALAEIVFCWAGW